MFDSISRIIGSTLSIAIKLPVKILVMIFNLIYKVLELLLKPFGWLGILISKPFKILADGLEVIDKKLNL